MQSYETNFAATTLNTQKVYEGEYNIQVIPRHKSNQDYNIELELKHQIRVNCNLLQIPTPVEFFTINPPAMTSIPQFDSEDIHFWENQPADQEFTITNWSTTVSAYISDYVYSCSLDYSLES